MSSGKVFQKNNGDGRQESLGLSSEDYCEPALVQSVRGIELYSASILAGVTGKQSLFIGNISYYV